MPELYLYLTVFLAALVTGLLILPTVIYICQKNNFMDEPDFRKKHTQAVPALGGLAIIASLMVVIMLFSDYSKDVMLYLFGSCILMSVGVKDDIIRIPAYKRLLLQLFVVGVLIAPSWGNIRIDDFHGFLGLSSISVEYALFFSLFVGTLLINSYNLIDGIDTLLGKIIAYNSVILFLCALYSQDIELAVVAIGVFGGVFAFLRYNWTPALIFMGDSGALPLGLTMVFFSFHLVSGSLILPLDLNPALFIMLLNAFPILDTLRVFTLRVIKRRSPFKFRKKFKKGR